MIKVTYTYTNGVRELVCSGHAGYGGKAAPPSPQGEGLGGDIVCAAASALTGTLAAVLLRREVYLAPSEEGAVEGGGTPSETEGEITPTGALQGVVSEDGEASSALSIRLRHDASEEGKLSLSLPPSSSASPRMPPPSSEGGKAAGGVSVSEGAGYCRIVCGGAAAKPYFEFALVGLRKLAEAFPENVRVAEFCESEVFH